MSNFFLLKSHDGEQSVLIDKDMIVGRDQSCDIVLSQGQASRQHAKVSPAEEGIRVEDLKSTNGTVVNGNKINDVVILKDGDELRIGKQQFVVCSTKDNTMDDNDATMLFGATEVVSGISQGSSTVPETPATPEPAAAPEPKPAPKAKPAAAPKPEAANLSDSNAPPSWVLSNQQAVDGTKFINKDAMKDALQQSKGPVTDTVEVPTLIGCSEPILGMRFQLAGGNAKQWEIGRSTNCEVMLNHDSVSSNHAQIIKEGVHWKLIDMMSANGTYVNAKKGLSSFLSSGDVLRFGQVECTFVLPEGAAKPAKRQMAATNDDGGGKSMVKTALTAFIITGVLAAAVIVAVSLLT